MPKIGRIVVLNYCLISSDIAYKAKIVRILFVSPTHRHQNVMTTEEALQELNNKAGSRFDSYLVQSFINMVREISDLKVTESS